MKLAITGYKGQKTETGNYDVPKELLKKGFQFLSEKGLELLEVNEITAINVGDTYGSDLIGIKLAQTYNIQPTVKQPAWDQYDSPSAAAKARNDQLLADADRIILFQNKGYYGGENLVAAVEKLKVPLLCYDLSEDTYFTCSSENIRENLKTKKATANVIDYVSIAKYLVKNQAIAFDTETTGIGKNDKIIQLALVDVNTQYVYYKSLIKTDVPTSEKALEVHGISDESRVDAPTLKQIYPIIRRFFDYPIVAYNAPYDYKMLKGDLEEIGVEMPCLRFEDLLPLCTAKFGEKMKLADVCKAMGIKPGTHDAASDAIAAAKVLKKLARG